MSYLDRLKRKISQDVPTGGATKGTKGAFDTFVATPAAPLRQISAANDPASIDREAFEERAAIMEFDGGLSRAEAERLALADPTENRAITMPCTDPEGGRWRG